MQATRRNASRRQGATLVLAAVAMITVAAVAALAIDMGMLYKAKGDAQRAAEAAALAGASAFVEFAQNDPVVEDTATVRALRFAQANRILMDTVQTLEVNSTSPLSPEVIRDSQLVRVVVKRDEVSTWFARLLGVTSVPISARAAAKAEAAGGGGCVKPFAIPDMWNDVNQDVSGDHLEQDGEDWTYDPGQDSYNPGNPDTPASGTGYGSNLRDGSGPYVNDFGRQISVRLPDPSGPAPRGPRQFVPFSPTNDGNDIDKYSDQIEGCEADVELGTSYLTMNNGLPIPAVTGQGLNNLINSDINASWDDNTQSIRNSVAQNWRSSPRVIKVGFFDPAQLPTSTAPMSTVTLNNIGLMFIESWDPTLNALTGRFFYFASGAGDLSHANTGTLVKRLRLVE